MMKFAVRDSTIGIFFVSWFAVFSGIWVILDPLGGISVLQKVGATKAFIYTLSVLFSALITHAGMCIINYQKTAQTRDPQLIDTTRAKFDYLSILKSSKITIDLLGLSLPTFSLESKIEFLRTKIREGVNVRIILLNPISPATLQRPEKLYEISSGVTETCINTLSVLRKLHRSGLSGKERESLEIALINIHPSIGIIKNEKQLFWSPYLSVATGAQSPFLVHDIEESAFAKALVKHFEALWNQYSLQLKDDTTLDQLYEFTKSSGLKPVKIPEHNQKILERLFDGDFQ